MPKLGKRVMVTGVPAAGKTTITSKPKIRDTYKVIEFGHEMYDIGQTWNLVKNKDDIATLPLPQRLELQTVVTGSIVAAGHQKVVVIDGHLLVDDSTGFAPGLPSDCIAMLDLAAVIFLHSKAADIIARREAEKGKYEKLRKWNDPEHVERHQQLAQSASLTYALISQASFFVIDNEQGNQAKAVAMLFDYLRATFP